LIRRPIDLYYRVGGGINTCGMIRSADKLSTEQMDGILHFLEALPYPNMLPADVREKVYPDGRK
jgi:hypothetical protein